jgi:hypothetical protein
MINVICESQFLKKIIYSFFSSFFLFLSSLSVPFSFHFLPSYKIFLIIKIIHLRSNG